MTLVGLLRHGDVAGSPCFRGSTDDPLNQQGWKQMRRATEQVRHWNRVITSPLQRCQKFANEYGIQQGLPINVEERFAEIDFGDWEGRTSAEIMTTQSDALKRFWVDPLNYTPPNAEPLIDFSTRVMEAWHKLICQWRNDRLLVVTHGGVIRVVLCQLKYNSIDKLLDIEVRHGDLFLVHVAEDSTNPSIKLIR